MHTDGPVTKLLWMCNAETPEAFFCQLTIVETCLDGRIEARLPEDSKWCALAPLFRHRRKKSLENRNKNRRKTLLGAECPKPIFLRECQLSKSYEFLTSEKSPTAGEVAQRGRCRILAYAHRNEAP